MVMKTIVMSLSVLTQEAIYANDADFLTISEDESAISKIRLEIPN